MKIRNVRTCAKDKQLSELQKVFIFF